MGAVAIRHGGSGDVTNTHVDWIVTKSIAECSSPVLYEGLIYWVTQRGLVVCVDPTTGEEVWKKRINGRFVGSPVAGDGKVYFPADNGEITVIRAGREFQLLARNTIGEDSSSSPAISNRHIFIRGKDHLFCISPSGG